jgi:hypothetical protein
MLPSTGEGTEAPNLLGPLPSLEDGNISSFRNIVPSSYLEYLKMNKGQKLSDSKCHLNCFKGQ